MTRSIKPLAWVLMGVGVLVLTAGAAAFRRAPSAPVAPPPAEVSVLTVAPETVAARYEYVGQAEASRSVEVRSQVTGVIVARPYAEGTDVAKGTLLFRIDPTTYEAAYRSAQARLANAERNLARLKSLLASRAVAQKDADDAQTAFDQAQAAVDQTKKDYDDTSVRAEIAGRVVRARLLGLKIPKAILVPQRAVQQGLGGAFVYVVADSGKVAVRNVVATSWDGGSWLIAEGLQTGDRVIVDGVQNAAPGAPVKAV